MKSPRALRARPPFSKGANSDPPLEKAGQGRFRGLRYRGDLKPLARSLRSNLTDAERALWQRLRGKQIEGVQFYRQKPLGEFIVDFYAPAMRLVMELDGGQHFDEEAVARDATRDRVLDGLGLMVLRFDNRQVLAEIEAVLQRVHQVVCGRLRNPPAPSKSPLPAFFKGG